jgi:hypothetical protein
VIGGPNHRSARPAPALPPPAPVDELKVAVIVGAQRSGTTWLQLMCAAHPKIAGGEELHLFSRYLGNVITTFYRDRRGSAVPGKSQGLPTLLTPPEFDGLLKQFASGVFCKLLQGKPGSELAIEKTPDHVLHLHYVRHLFPQVKILHVIRDPRDVVVSQLAAGATWGADWFPKTAEESAQRWVEWVSAGRKYADVENYTEVRYETLLSDGPRELARVYDFLGYPLPVEQVERMYEQFTMANIKAGKMPRVLVHPAQQAGVKGKPSSPGANGAGEKAATAAAAGGAGAATPGAMKPLEAFFRKGQAGGWRESLTEEQVRSVERIAGPLMRELGYAPAELAHAELSAS